MVVLGLILVLVAVVAGVVLVYDNSGRGHSVSVSAFGGHWQVDAFWLAVVGAAILLVGVLGVALIRGGSRRSLRRRQERKQLERENAALADRVRHTGHDERPGRRDEVRAPDPPRGTSRTRGRRPGRTDGVRPGPPARQRPPGAAADRYPLSGTRRPAPVPVPRRRHGPVRLTG